MTILPAKETQRRGQVPLGLGACGVGQISHSYCTFIVKRWHFWSILKHPLKPLKMYLHIKTYLKARKLFSRCTRFRTSISRESRKTSPQGTRRRSSGEAVLPRSIWELPNGETERDCSIPFRLSELKLYVFQTSQIIAGKYSSP